MSAKEAQLATCELGQLHWAGHCPLTPSTTDSRSKISTLKYNIILCNIANAHCLARFAVATAVTEVYVLLNCCLRTVGKYILLLICLLLYQLPILFDCRHVKSNSPRSTNFLTVIRTGDKRSKNAIKYLCGSKNSHIRNKMYASFSFKISCFLVTQQCIPSRSVQNSQRHSSYFMKLSPGRLRNCIVSDHMIRSAGM